jgi:hypothetical protein
MPSTPKPVEATVPVLVIDRGLSAVPRTSGPVVLVLIVLDIGLSLVISRQLRAWPGEGHTAARVPASQGQKRFSNAKRCLHTSHIFCAPRMRALFAATVGRGIDQYG